MSRRARNRILIVAPSGGAFGGVEIFSIKIAQELFHSGLFEVRVVFRLMKGWRPDPRFTESLAGLPFPSALLMGLRPAILREIAWADAVNCHFPLLDVTFPTRAMGKKLVLTVENRRISRHHFLHWFGLCLAHRRWYISEFVARTWEGKQRRRGSSVVPAISDLPSRRIDPERRKGFLFIARWVPQKGLQELISAYTEADIEPAACPLTLVGDGPLRPLVTRAITQSKRRQFIFDRGFISTAEKHDLLAHTRWNVAPATFEEDLGLTPIEARACGVPSIVSDIGGLPEAAGPAGILCQPGDPDALRRSLEHALHMPQNEYAARSVLAKKSLDAYLPPEGFYIDAFSNLLGQPRHASAPSPVILPAPKPRSAQHNGRASG